MEIKVIFEDNENTPSSILLRKCQNGKNIIFSNGAARVRGTLERVYNEEDYILGFRYVKKRFPVKLCGKKCRNDMIRYAMKWELKKLKYNTEAYRYGLENKAV